MQRDQIYENSQALVEKFCFDKKVVVVFQDMIRRSVPGYAMILSLIGIVAEQYLQKDTSFFDLGASLGASTLAVNDIAIQRNCRVVAVDNSTAMIEQAKKIFSEIPAVHNVEFVHQDVCLMPIENASMVVMNFILQFIPVSQRHELLERIYAGMLPGGILFLSEKICGESDQQETCLYSLHHGFKRANGYSQLEVSKKRDALEGVMITEKLSLHRERLTDIGFSRVEVVFQALNFVSMLVFK
jgi:tRNA (cmo5U34)-methyltransferase